MSAIVKNKKALVGILFVGIGILLILKNLHYFPGIIPGWLFSWPSLLILIGITILLTSENITPGIVLIGIGVFFLMPSFFNTMWHQIGDYWPLIFVIIGVSMILNRNRRRHPRRDVPHFEKKNGIENEDEIDEIAIFGGGEKVITSQQFSGGRLTAIFGGSEINLLSSKLNEGTNTLEVFAMFGGWSLIVPDHWNIEVNITPIFGGFSDERRLSPDAFTDHSRKIVIKGFVIFGGGEIKGVKVQK